MKFEELPRNKKGEVFAGKVDFPIETALMRPVEAHGREIRSLALPEPTALDIEEMYQHDSEATRMVHRPSNRVLP